MINLKRAYDEPASADGYRVLVDRLWPRGISKEKAQIDEWMKDISPSNELRKWFHANPSEWEKFREKYFSELKEHKEQLRSLTEKSRTGEVTLVYSSKNKEQNNAIVLKQYLELLLK